jgi:hypothetical protein
MVEDKNKSWLQGHVLIRDKDTREVLVDKMNAINYENFSISLAQTVANRPAAWIQNMVFGNGAATVSGTGTITYLPPNVVGTQAELYNETYFQCVNDMSPLNADPANNYMKVSHTSGMTYSDVTITCTLGLGQPAGQEAFDNTTNISGTYVFNEIGLKAYNATDAATNTDTYGLLLSHVIFSPVQKSLNRQIEIVYTIRIQTV